MKKIKLPIRILWNLSPALLWLCLAPMGLWAALPMALLQAAIAFLNFKYSTRPLSTVLLGLELMVASAAGCFFSGIIYFAFLNQAVRDVDHLAILFMAELGYTLLLMLASTLARWCGKRGERKRRLLLILASMMIGGLYGWLISRGEAPISNGRGHLPLLLLELFGAVVLVTTLHELGHLIMGLLMGYRFYGFRLGPLHWRMENNHLSFQLRPTHGISGACLMLPPPEMEGNGRHLLYIAGGVLANLATGILVLLLPLEGALWSAARVFGCLSLFTVVVNALPFYSMGNPTDGKQFWGLLLGTREGGYLAAANRQSVLLRTGTRPRDLPPLPPLSERPRGTELLSRLSGDYFRLLDASDYGGAGESLRFLEGHIASFPSSALPALDYELCFYACIAGDKARAEELHVKIRKDLEKDQDLNGMRVKAYCAWYLAADEATARSSCLQALKVAHLFPFPGQAVMERELVEKLLAVLPKGERA